MRHTLLRTAAIAVVASLSAAGCSGSSSSGTAASPSSPAAKTTTTVALTGAPVKVMVISERSGPAAATFMGDGAVAAAKEINASGGIGGRPIDVTLCDTSNDPNTAAGCARRAATGGFVALVATWTNQEASVLPITDAAGLPNIGNYPLSAPGFTSHNAFPLDGGTPFSAIGIIRALQQTGVKKTSFVIPDIAGTGSAVINLLASVVGKTAIGSVVRYPNPTPDMTSYVATALHGGDGVVCGGGFDDEVRFVRTFQQSGSNARLGLLNNDPEGLAKTLGAAGEGIVLASFSKPITVDDAPVRKFVTAMKTAGLPVTSEAEEGYAAVYLLAQAAKGLPTINRANLLTALNTTTHFDIGLLAPVDFTKPQQAIPGGLRIFNTRMLAQQIKHGKVISQTQFFDAAAPPPS